MKRDARPPGTAQPIPEKIRKPQWPLMEEVPLFPPEFAQPEPEDLLRPGRFKKKGYRLLPVFPRGTVQRFRKNRKGMIGLCMLATAILMAVLAPILSLHDPLFHFSTEEYVRHPPTLMYPLGTDIMGRDIYSQVIWGFRPALAIAIPSALLVGIIGTLVGLIAGYCGGFIDDILQRISITFLVWPSVPFVALIAYSWGGYQAHLAIVLGVTFTLWPTTARAIRAEVMSLKTRAFIEAARVSGAPFQRIVFRHILPNVVHLSFLYMTIAVTSALVLEATVNFLGMGNLGVISWGNMLTFTLRVTGYSPWWTVLPPGVALSSMILSFFLISVGLRESMRISPVRF